MSIGGPERGFPVALVCSPNGTVAVEGSQNLRGFSALPHELPTSPSRTRRTNHRVTPNRYEMKRLNGPASRV